LRVELQKFVSRARIGTEINLNLLQSYSDGKKFMPKRLCFFSFQCRGNVNDGQILGFPSNTILIATRVFGSHPFAPPSCSLAANFDGFVMLRQLQSVNRSVSVPVYQTPIVELVMPRLDYVASRQLT
jgi:hypothetical protein